MQKTTIKTKLLTVLLTLCMVLSLMPISAFAADSTVSNEAELEAALENADCTEIKLGGNIEVTGELNVERTVILDLNGYTLSCSLTDEDMIRVRSSGSLTIKDSGTGGRIDGQNKNCGFNVRGGTLTLESGSIVNCRTDGDGGAVDVSNTGVTETPVKYGKFIMNGGSIMDCKASDDGGAVDIGSGCTFIMNGGTIGNCRADDDGGAVFIKQSGTFELNGGTIQNCSAGANGGAVNIYEDGRFTMTGGTIKSCQVDLGGLGMAVYGSNDKAVVTMIGGTFEDCGAFPYSFDEFTVTFDSDGGSAVSEQKLRNATAVKPADPKKSGYDFAGWYLGDMQYAFDTKVTADITLKARWTACDHSGHTGAQPTCTDSVICTVCNGTIPALGHDWGEWTSNGDGTHTRTCKRDDTHTETNDCSDADKDHKCDLCGKVLSSHTGGKATCKDKAVCEICGEAYGEPDADNHAGLKHIHAKAATKDAEGHIEYWHCEGCGKYYSDKDGTKEITKADTVTKKLSDGSKSPKTGDNSGIVLWIALVLIGGGVLTGAVVFDKRKKRLFK